MSLAASSKTDDDDDDDFVKCHRINRKCGSVRSIDVGVCYNLRKKTTEYIAIVGQIL